ncbi:MAG: nitrous oxide reductase accessory protein NosL [Paracoccus sp. (in: a-proteobacteria)]
MGAPELVPFSDPDKARAYIAQYGGQLRELSQILDSEVLGTADDSAPDTAPATDAVPPDDGDYARRLRALTPGETQPATR